MTASLGSLGDRKRERIDALAARAGALPEGDGGVSLIKSAYRRLRRDPVAIIGAVIVVVFLLVAILFMNRFIPRFWCRALCPLGAFLEQDVERLGVQQPTPFLLRLLQLVEVLRGALGHPAVQPPARR